MSTADEAAALLAEYERRWAARDVAGLRALWDVADPDPVYVAEEEREPLRSWPAIEAYWASTMAAISRVAVRTRDLHVRAVSETVLLLFFQMHWDAAVGRQAPIGGDVRVSSLCRATPAGLRFFHWVEAPVAALTQLRMAHERAVTPGFAP